MCQSLYYIIIACMLGDERPLSSYSIVHRGGRFGQEQWYKMMMNNEQCNSWLFGDHIFWRQRVTMRSASPYHGGINVLGYTTLVAHSISSNVGRRSKVIPHGCVWKWRRPWKIRMSIGKRMIDQEMEIEWGTHGYPWYPIRRLTLMCVPTTKNVCHGPGHPSFL